MQKRTLLASAIACCAVLLWPGIARADDVFVNDKFPITGHGGPTLSPPVISAVDECASHVYVISFMPKATVKVILNGVNIIGVDTPKFAFKAIKLSQRVHFGDKLTATQTVNAVTSAPSNPAVVVGKMPSPLPAPSVDKTIYACAHIVPVHGLLPGVDVAVQDVSVANALIGKGFSPNDWGSDWDPVFTTKLVQGDKITATQSACGAAISAVAAPQIVLPEPMPLQPPILDSPIVGNDALTLHHLYTGALLEAFDHAAGIGSGFATGSDNWMSVTKIKPTGVLTAQQSLCHRGPRSQPQVPTQRIPAPVLLSPICPKQPSATVRNSTIDATLVLIKNGIVVGNGGAAPGDVALAIAPPAAFANGDQVRVVQYIENSVSPSSNVVTVDCDSVTTYHYDNLRTGWYPGETVLTPAAVKKQFGRRHTVELDDQVDVQPLIMTGENITAGSRGGKHDVVYVETESNTVYAIDAASGAILLKLNLGKPVPQPLGCTNNGPNVGIDGTPVIDRATNTMYVVTYSLENENPVYRIHELDLGNLTDKKPSVVVSGSHRLTDGSVYTFNATVQRQRPALLEANGNVYVAFGSFCDFAAANSRGWLLGWQKGTLAPLAANHINDTQVTSPNSFFLTAIWMSGYGVAGDPSGTLFFQTGNSDYSGTTYDGVTNIQESVVNVTADLTKVLSIFTPSDQATLDKNDTDLGSGGALLLPAQNGAIPRLAAAVGKDGRMFLMNRDSLGGYTPGGPNKVVATKDVGGCWCGQSYFLAADGIGRIVSSGGTSVQTWKVNTIPTTQLVHEASSAALNSGQDPGFFTVVSTNGTQAGTGIVWAVSHPVKNPFDVSLYAFGATPVAGALPTLFTGTAGTWPNTNGNANIVPVVSHGRVYVASYKQLAIFGL